MVDAGYRGEVLLLFVNFGRAPQEIHQGDRCAQLAVRPVPEVRFVVRDELRPSKRGRNGFGSTGGM